MERSFASEGISVQRRARIPDVDSGQPREVDVLLEGSLGSAQLRVIVECRDRASVADVTWIEQLATKRRSVGASHVIAVSTSGFTSSAIVKANRENVELRSLVELSQDDIKNNPSKLLISMPRINHRIHEKVKLFVAPLGCDEPTSSLEASIDKVSVFLEPATGLRGHLTLDKFLEYCIRREFDEPILTSNQNLISQGSPVPTVAEVLPFDFATPTPREFRVAVNNNTYQLLRVCGYVTTSLELMMSSDIGGYEYRRMNEVESGLFGTISVIGAPFPDGRIWPFIYHRAPPPGKAVVYICSLDFLFDAVPSDPQKTAALPNGR